MNWKEARWMLLVILQEFYMFKFYSIWRFFIDSQYANDIRKLRTILAPEKLTARLQEVRLGQVSFSHAISYPDWVADLVVKIRAGVELPPIKVYEYQGKLLVIDGNHRLAAMKITMDPATKIMVRRLYPISQAPPKEPSCWTCHDTGQVFGESCQECCPHDEHDHFICLDCGCEGEPSDYGNEEAYGEER